MSRRPIAFDSPSDVIAEALRLHSTGYTQAGSWNLAQICTHLAQAVEASRDGFGNWRGPWLMRMLARPILHIVLMTRWIPTGVKLPEAALPAEAANEAAAVERLSRAMEFLTRHDGPWSPHPYFGNMTTQQWRRYHLIHAAHHLSFLITTDTAPD